MNGVFCFHRSDASIQHHCIVGWFWFWFWFGFCLLRSPPRTPRGLSRRGDPGQKVNRSSAIHCQNSRPTGTVLTSIVRHPPRRADGFRTGDLGGRPRVSWEGDLKFEGSHGCDAGLASQGRPVWPSSSAGFGLMFGVLCQTIPCITGTGSRPGSRQTGEPKKRHPHERKSGKGRRSRAKIRSSVTNVALRWEVWNCRPWWCNQVRSIG